MRILCVCPFYKPAYIYGGPSKSIPALMEGLVSLGCDVSVFTTNANGKNNFNFQACNENESNGVSVAYFNRDLPGSYFFSRELSKACSNQIREFDFVYIVSTWGYPLIPACSAAIKSSKPYFVSPRTAFMQKTWKKYDLKKWFYHTLFERSIINHATAIHYTTEYERKESCWLHLTTPSFVVSNPFSAKEFMNLPKRGLFRLALNISSKSIVLLYLGRIEHRKGLDLTINAFASACKRVSNLTLILAGPDEDNYSNVLKRMSIELGIQDKVIFTGYLDQTKRLSALADADIFILSSYSENFGMAVLEAMASGLPVIVSEQVGIAEDIASSNSGRVVRLQSDVIAEVMIDLSLSKEARKQYGERARSFAIAQYSPETIAKSMLMHFENSLSQTSKS